MTTPNAVDATHQNGHPKTTEEIQLEIARTRSAITEDLVVLSERFSPQQLKESAKEIIQEARHEAKGLLRDAKEVALGRLIGIKDRAVESVNERVGLLGERASALGDHARHAGGLTVDYVSSHALLLSLVGAGAGWLLMALRNYRRVQRGEYDYRYEHYSYPVEARVEHPARSQASPRAVATLATRGADRARERARQASRSLRDSADSVRVTASNHPFAALALTVVAGLGIGLLLPVGRGPRRAMRRSGTRMWEGAQNIAHEAAASTSRLASQANDALRS